MRASGWICASAFLWCGALSCGGGSAEGFGPGSLDAQPPPPPRVAAAGAPSGGPSPPCEAAVATMERRLTRAIGHHLGRSPVPVDLPKVSGAAPGRPGRLSVAVTGESVHLQGWTFALAEEKEIARVFDAERRVADLMMHEGAPDVRTVDLWVDASVPVPVLHQVLSYIPEELEPRIVVALSEVSGELPGAGEPEWVRDFAEELASDEVTIVEGALGRGFARAAPDCDPLREALTASKLVDYDEKSELFVAAVASGARSCNCEGIDLDALAALTLLATRATGSMTGVFAFSTTGASLVSPRTASVGGLAQQLSSRAAAEWVEPVALKLDGD